MINNGKVPCITGNMINNEKVPCITMMFVLLQTSGQKNAELLRM